MSGTDSESGARASGASRWTTWHQQAFAAVTRWTWLYTLNDRVTAVVQPVYDQAPRVCESDALSVAPAGLWSRCGTPQAIHSPQHLGET